MHPKKHYGYSLKNTKCFITVPENRGRNVSLMLAIKHNGIVAKGIIEGVFNGYSFKDYIVNNFKQNFIDNPRDVLKKELHWMTSGIICVPRLKEVFLVTNFIKLV
ncbi:hypothetical protein HZS_5785 [Henneguya salminicola]|nr:hypothetical protein HZS_5785 [Henneguya salminicola]